MTVLEEFYQRHPEFDIRSNDGLLVTNCQFPMSMQRLEEAAARLTGRLAVNGNYVRRKRLIDELDEGKGSYRYFDNQLGQYRRYPIDELYTVDDTELQRIYDLVTSQRKAVARPRNREQVQAHSLQAPQAQAQPPQGQGTEPFVLCHPDTNIPFDRASLIAFINSGDKFAMRKILVDPSTGRADPRAKAEIERILRSRQQL